MTARLRAELATALREGQMVGYFQPEVELSTGRLVAAELLARWEHPELGTLQPALFVPLAGELGLASEFTRLMLVQALEQYRDWAIAGWDVPVSVNIVPGCVTDPDFPADVARLLRDKRLPGRALTLEVSEETGTMAASTRFFAQLGELGVRVSLDDFGTGFASLESLGGWPIDELKLDRSIVQPVIISASFRTIVSTTVSLARQLGLKVVAEGVDSEAVRSELSALGCDIGQGFFLGQPMPAATFTSWLRERGELVPRLPLSGQPGGGIARRAARRAIHAVRQAVKPIGGPPLALLLAMVTGYGLWRLFRWGVPGNQALIGALAFVPLTGATTVLGWQASRRVDLGQRTRRAWGLLAVGAAFDLLGGLFQLVYEGILHTKSLPVWAYASYLGFYAATFWGLISFPGRSWSRQERQRLLLDTGMVLVGGLVFIWYMAIRPVTVQGAHLSLIDFARYAYPVSDMLLLFGALTVLSRGAPRSSATALWIFACGLLAVIAADLTFSYISLHSTYNSGDPVDSLWFLSVAIMYVAFAWQLRARPASGFTSPLRPASGRPAILPYVAVVASFLLVVIVGLDTTEFAPMGGILLGAMVLTFLVAARQYYAIWDYGRLTLRYRELAAIDSVTGLYNRRHLMEAAETALAHAQQLGQPLTALMIDVDNFKQINDVHGHVVGDQVLAELARTCRERIRPVDFVGRYGGDEFVIMVPGITSLRAVQLAVQLTRPTTSVAGHDGRLLPYTVSIGIAESPPGGDLSALLARADLAMYQAKRAGGACWRIVNHSTGGPARTAGVPPGFARRL